MSLYLDSAFPEDASKAFAWGFVDGITTNPTLMARTQHPQEEILSQLCDIASGTVFVQLRADTVQERRDEGLKLLSVRPDQIGLKLACTLENLSLASTFAEEGYTVGITAIFSPAQVYLACMAGAHFVLPYVNRSTQLLGDGLHLITEMRDVIESCGAYTQILAASVKSPSEAASIIQAGAHHLTLPLKVMQDMAHHHLSEQAITEFAKNS